MAASAPPPGRAVWRLLTWSYGVGLLLVAAIVIASHATQLDAGVRVPATQRISTPPEVLRTPSGWTRIGDAAFRRGEVTGTIERSAVPRRELVRSQDRVRFLERYLRDELVSADATGRARWDEATPLAGLTGHIASFSYEDTDGVSFVRVDHVMTNALIERAWTFRAWYPADSVNRDESRQFASRLPDDFEFPGIRIPAQR